MTEYEEKKLKLLSEISQSLKVLAFARIDKWDMRSEIRHPIDDGKGRYCVMLKAKHIVENLFADEEEIRPMVR